MSENTKEKGMTGFYAPGEKIEVSSVITTGTVGLHQILSEDDSCLNRIGDEVDDYTVVDVIEGDDGRWTRTDQIIVQHGDSYYAFDYEVGLTEYQECGPFEYGGIDIKRVQKKVEVIESVTWVPVD